MLSLRGQVVLEGWMKAKISLALMVILTSGSAIAACATPSGPGYPTICYLGGAYDPQKQPYQPPQCSGTPVSLGERAVITRAFDLAHSRVQADMCRLNTIFITSSNIGVRENPADQGTGKYIFLDARLLNGGGGATLAAEEAATQNAVLTQLGNTNVTLQYSAAPDNGFLGVLAVMAHEMGHVNWYDKKVGAKPCFVSSFMNPTWTGSVPNRRWVNFAAPTANDHSVDPDTHPKKRRLTPGKVKKLYDNYVSVFAAVSPEEDYVESYKLSALLSDVVQNVAAFSANGNDILANAQRQPIRGKLACVRSL
jgi:hypothetical protein